MSVWMFPGQGSQRVGMGEELFGECPDWMEQADAIMGLSVRELCLHDPRGLLNQTRYTQPALYTVNALAWRVRRHKGEKPAWLIGHSLGEYNALLAAGVFDFAAGLRLVRRRGELMAAVQGGGMAAVIGLEEPRVRETLQQEELRQVDIANLNTKTQIVIAGPKEIVEQACAALRKAGARRIVPLPVSGAFHSRAMRATQQEFAQAIQQVSLNPPAIPVIANATAQPYLRSAEAIAQTLVQQIASPVRWVESIQFLLRQGEEEFEEIGPGNVLAGLVRKIRITD
ncbi:MAG: ACP S-malonyltransferase [Myxococcota bacterium]